MKAAVIREHGSYDKILFEEREKPSLKEDGKALIRVKAVSLNHLDLWVRRGVPGHRFPLPMVPGSDISGVYEAGSSRRFKPGDRVVVNPAVFCGECDLCKSGRDNLCRHWGLLGETTDGGCQDYIIVSESNLAHVPEHMSFEQAACIPIAYVTAWEMLVNKARIQQGQSILIHAAGSAVSVACIQIAKIFGLQIIVTSTNEQKLGRARGLGAHRFIDTTRSLISEDVRHMTSKAGVDVVVDHIGGGSIMESVRCLKKGGVLVSCGATASSEVKLDWKHIFFKNIALLGSTYGPQQAFNAVVEHFASKDLSAVVDSRVPFMEIAAAHRMLEERKVFGKVVVTL